MDKRNLTPRKSSTVKKKMVRISGFHRLPTEMVENILNKLPIADKKSARLVSTYWKSVLERAVRYSLPLTNVTMSNLNSKEFKINELTVLLDQLEIPPRLPLKLKASLNTVKALHFKANDKDGLPHVIVDTVVVKSLIKCCQNIERLRFDFLNMKACRSNVMLGLHTVQLQFLTKLEVRQPFGGPIEVASALFSLLTPCLQYLEVDRFSINARGTERDAKLYMTLQKCLARNRRSLKNLKLINWMTSVYMAPFPEETYPNGLLDELSQLKLESLEIRHREDFWLHGPIHALNPMLFNIFGMEGWVAANRLLNNQRSLKVLKLDTNSNALIHRTYNLLSMNRLTLTKLELDLTGAMMDFDIRILPSLTALKDFSFRSDDYEFGPFPASLRNLYWDAPLGLGWYLSDNRHIYKRLVNMTLGHRAQRYMNLRTFCMVLVSSGAVKVDMQQLILERKVYIAEDRMETRSMTKRRNRDLQDPLHLPSQFFEIEYDDEFIYIIFK